MTLNRRSGFRCPQCNAAHHWVVDECDACGYRSEASLGWEREGIRETRQSWFSGWSWWCIGDMVELLFWGGRLLFGAVRAVVASWL